MPQIDRQTTTRHSAVHQRSREQRFAGMISACDCPALAAICLPAVGGSYYHAWTQESSVRKVKHDHT